MCRVCEHIGGSVAKRYRIDISAVKCGDCSLSGTLSAGQSLPVFRLAHAAHGLPATIDYLILTFLRTTAVFALRGCSKNANRLAVDFFAITTSLALDVDKVIAVNMGPVLLRQCQRIQRLTLSAGNQAGEETPRVEWLPDLIMRNAGSLRHFETAVTDRELLALSRCSRLEHVGFRSDALSKRALELFACRRKNLTSLTVRWDEFTDEDPELPAILAKLGGGGLRTLTCDVGSREWQELLVNEQRSLSSLTNLELNLRGCVAGLSPLRLPSLSAFSGSSLLPCVADAQDLTSLKCGWDEKLASALTEKRWPQLTRLRILGSTSGSFVQALPYWRHLQHLHLQFAASPVPGYTYVDLTRLLLAELPMLRRLACSWEETDNSRKPDKAKRCGGVHGSSLRLLTELCLRPGSTITNFHLVLEGFSFPAVQHLTLGAGKASASLLHKFPALNCLTLRGTQMDLQFAVWTVHSSRLRSITLSDVIIGHDSAIAMLSALPALQEVRFIGCGLPASDEPLTVAFLLELTVVPGGFPQLAKLVFCQADVASTLTQDAAIGTIAALSNACPRLRFLGLQAAGVDEWDGWEALRERYVHHRVPWLALHIAPERDRVLQGVSWHEDYLLS